MSTQTIADIMLFISGEYPNEEAFIQALHSDAQLATQYDTMREELATISRARIKCTEAETQQLLQTLHNHAGAILH
jgi:hypothetical protein